MNPSGRLRSRSSDLCTPTRRTPGLVGNSTSRRSPRGFPQRTWLAGLAMLATSAAYGLNFSVVTQQDIFEPVLGPWTTPQSGDRNAAHCAAIAQTADGTLIAAWRNLYGPQKIELRSSVDDYAAPIATWDTPPDQTVDYYVELPPNLFGMVSGAATFRLYGYGATPDKTPQSFRFHNYLFRDGLKIKGHPMCFEGEVRDTTASGAKQPCTAPRHPPARTCLISPKVSGKTTAASGTPNL